MALNLPGTCPTGLRRGSHGSYRQQGLKCAPKHIPSQHTQGRCARNLCTHVATVDTLSEQEAIAGAKAAADKLGGWFAPPMTDQPASLLPQHVPFLTRQAGALPFKPASLDHALYAYGK